jgi:hypothetical protein
MTRFFEDPALKPGQWKVDGELQAADITEEALEEALGGDPRRIDVGDGAQLAEMTGQGRPGRLAPPTPEPDDAA